MSNRLTRLLRSLASADLAYELWQAGPRRNLREIVSNSYGGRPAMRLAVEALRTIDMAALHDTVARIESRHSKLSKQKYLAVGAPLARAACHAISLGLNQNPGKSLLDLGTGAGFLPYMAGHLGHDAVAIDLAGHPIYDELVGFLGVKRVVHKIEAGRPLPDFGRRFAAVTALQVMFDHKSTGVWGTEEWDWFLNETASRHLEPGGLLLVGLNDRPAHASTRARVAALFERCGAVPEQYALLMTRSGIERRHS